MARTPPSGRLALRALAGPDRVRPARGLGLHKHPRSPPGDNALHPSEAWFAAYDAALRQGVFNAGSFYTDDAVVDLRSVGRPVVAGREDLLEALGARSSPTATRPPGGFRHLRLTYRSSRGRARARAVSGSQPTGRTQRLRS